MAIMKANLRVRRQYLSEGGRRLLQRVERELDR